MPSIHDHEIGELLRLAAAQLPPDIPSDEVQDYLDHEEYDLVLDLLSDHPGNTWQTPRFWALLTEAAIQLDHDPSWPQWRCVESIQGLLRVQLTLAHSADPLNARNERPTWDLTGETRVAALWIESKPTLHAGERATARLRPFVPPAWAHLAKGDQITLLGPSPGTARVIEKVPPRP
ncbi:hypothetical protein BBK82_12245 [Lentzea guizhouensis]|uniref:Uncharacterized protein n=1 Tax=Lentzea guizhouensis TaxID=1586287 RepID=A0A1B2HG94_9PSEU|nr:hypothetical protein [Lentzea guizhouensis]ANZ36725.1 hypothetical protein BBK82_12245 [Lentzea guizhouensis]